MLHIVVPYINPRTCAMGKVIGLSVIVVIVVFNTKTARSGDIARHLDEL